MNIILASKSPRREELLHKLFPEFEVKESHFEEKYPKKIKVCKIPEYLALQKALQVQEENSLVISADTIVCLKNEILHKPKNAEEAFNTLQKLSNKKHKVITGVCAIYKDQIFTFSCKTIVQFYKLSKQDIENYIATKSPFDKAGGYGIQDRGALFIKNIRGDYYNVMGLPIAKLKQLLNKIL